MINRQRNANVIKIGNSQSSSVYWQISVVPTLFSVWNASR